MPQLLGRDKSQPESLEQEAGLRRTKIVCTIGPGSNSPLILTRLLRVGMDVARLKFSHGEHAEHAHVITLLRKLAQQTAKSLAILQDLSGPKVRLGTLSAPSVFVKRGQEVALVSAEYASAQTQKALLNRSEAVSTSTLLHLSQASKTIKSIDGAEMGQSDCLFLPLPIPELLAALRPNNTLLIDDGKLSLRVTRCEGEPGAPDRCVWARCLVSGEIKSRKGVSAPGVAFSTPAITEKDLDDLRFGLAQGVDWVAASYVRNAADLQPLRATMNEVGIYAPLIAKIEKWEAVQNLEEILASVDGIMVARGDLGVEMDLDEVPIVQKRIIKACNRAGKPVITATQMLESMISNPRPTRAEATDVANAVLDGTDAVMLSGETAVGQFPVEAVKIMARITLRAEEAFFAESDFARRLLTPKTVTEVVACATADMAQNIKARAILCATSTGTTARRVAQYRPNVPILGITTNQKAAARLALTWGVLPCCIAPVDDTDSLMYAVIAAAIEHKMVRDGDCVVLTAGVPVHSPGTTNLIKVHTVGQPLSPPISKTELKII